MTTNPNRSSEDFYQQHGALPSSTVEERTNIRTPETEQLSAALEQQASRADALLTAAAGAQLAETTQEPTTINTPPPTTAVTTTVAETSALQNYTARYAGPITTSPEVRAQILKNNPPPYWHVPYYLTKHSLFGDAVVKMPLKVSIVT